MTEFTLTKAQDRATDVLISDAKHIALYGGGRCVSGDAVLDGHRKTIKELAEIGLPVKVMTAYGNQWASAPYCSGEDKLLRIEMDSGRVIEVTDDHLFYDGNKWINAKDLSIGSSVASLLCEQSLQESSSVSCLSMFLLSARRLRQRLLSYQDGYSLYRHQCDQQPLCGGAYDQAYRALLCDEQEHNHQNQYQHDHVSLLRGLSNCIQSLFSLAVKYTRCDQLLNLLSSKGGSPLFDQRELSQVYACEQTSELSQGLHQNDSLYQRLLSFHQSFLLQLGTLRVVCDQFFYPAHTYSDTPVSGFYLDKVCSITETAKKEYYTLYVPNTEQYYANGILCHNSGKTFILLWAIINRALKVSSRHVVFRFTFASCKQSIVLETMPKVIKICFPELPSFDSMINKTDWYMTLPNGSEIWFSGMETGERMDKILGKEYSTLYFNECSQIPFDSIETARSRLAQQNELVKKAYYDFNPTSKLHWSYVQFVEKKNPVDNQPLKNPELYAHYRINPIDNIENIDSGYIQELENASEKKRNRFLHGIFSDADDGALFTVEVMAQNRRLGQENQPLPEWQRVIIAVDPSGCDGSTESKSDEVGIVVVALGTDGHAYLLEDLSGKFSPHEWATVVGQAYDRHSADRVVAEKNYGGEMVRYTLQAHNSALPVELVNATRGKIVRAEPISELYAQNKVHHVGYFQEIEDQLCSMMLSGYIGLKSPDRADALIWGVTALFPKMTKKVDNRSRKPTVKAPKRGASRFKVRRL